MKYSFQSLHRARGDLKILPPCLATLQLPSSRAFPDEEGTERIFPCQVITARFQVPEPSPMKRGLKARGLHMVSDRPLEVPEPSPMKRGLKDNPTRAGLAR